MLSEEEGGLMEGMGTVALVQGMSKKSAQISETRVLHINSGRNYSAYARRGFATLDFRRIEPRFGQSGGYKPP